jgi:hypothetical protein
MIRSGRMRNELRTRSRMVTSPRPSMLGGRLSRRTTWRWRSWSSTASSIVTILGVGDEARQNVEQRGLAGAGAAGNEHVQPGRTTTSSSSASSGVSVPNSDEVVDL